MKKVQEAGSRHRSRRELHPKDGKYTGYVGRQEQYEGQPPETVPYYSSHTPTIQQWYTWPGRTLQQHQRPRNTGIGAARQCQALFTCEKGCSAIPKKNARGRAGLKALKRNILFYQKGESGKIEDAAQQRGFRC